MWYGWTGVGLEVDLSSGNIKKSPGDKETYQNYLGGHALITKLFWDRVPPEVEPFSPDNLLIFGAGPLVGTVAPAACRTAVVTRSALTEYMSHSNMGGFWGPELKFAGYDTLTISGKSAAPVYIYINNDKVEIRDASHLWGQDVYQTQRMIRKELKDEKIQTLCIGLAGENKVSFADISHGPGCSLSRGGAGAVMGDKKLKAIAIRGNKNINIAKPVQFFGLCEDILNRSAFVEAEETARWPDPVHGNLYHNVLMGMLNKRYRNFEFTRTWENAQREFLDFLVARKALPVGCYNCQLPCIYGIHLPDGETVFWKCVSRHFWTHTGDVQDWGYSLRCISLVQRYGMDNHSSATLCRFAIDLFQKGILTAEDTGGLVLEWGNPEVCPALLEKIAHRQDIGDVLANGVLRAASQIGRGAEQYAYHFKRMEARGAASSARRAIAGFISDRGDNTLSHGAFGYDEMLQELKDPEEVKKWKDYLASVAQGRDEIAAEREMLWTLKYPDEASKRQSRPPGSAMSEVGANGEIKEKKVYVDGAMLGKKAAFESESGIISDSTGLCYARFGKDDNLGEIGTAFRAELASYATGADLDYEKAMKCARRARALTRAYNAILGDRVRPGDLESQTLLRDPKESGALKELLRDAFQATGYNEEGIPTREHLEELGLEDVARELEQRGILPKPVSVTG